MSISLFLLNKKGLNVITEITKNPLLLNLIDSVVLAKDAGNSEDCYEEIKQIAIKNNRFEKRLLQ